MIFNKLLSLNRKLTTIVQEGMRIINSLLWREFMIKSYPELNCVHGKESLLNRVELIDIL